MMMSTSFAVRGFHDRRDAGQKLAAAVRSLRLQDPIVLGLPRGGLPVAAEVSRALGAPLDVWVAKKIGAPRNPEVAIAAVGEGGDVVVDPDHVRVTGADAAWLQAAAGQRIREVEAAALRFREGRPPPRVRGREVIVVDDGVATGLTALAALRDLKKAGAARVILAVPVGATASLAQLATVADDVVCPLVLDDLMSVGENYEDFTQVQDETVLALLQAARRRAA